MKKVILIALLFIALKAHSQGGNYTLANKPINLGWADNSGTVNIRGRLYVRVMDNGVATDSVLTVLNGAVRKIAINDLVTLSSITGILSSTKGGSGVNNAGTLTWGAGGTLGSAAYLDASTGHTSAGTVALRDESGKTGLEDLYLGSGYNDWLSTILTGKASTSSLDNYLLKTGGTLTGNLTLPYDGTLAFKNSSDVQKQVLSYNNNTYLDAADGSIFFRNGASFTTRYTIDASGNHDFGSGTLKTSSLTPGRVPYIGTAGLIQDDADLTFDGSNLSVGGSTSISGNINQGTAGAAGALTLIRNLSDPNTINRLVYGTDDSGYRFAIGKNVAGTVTDQLTFFDNNTAQFASTVTVADATASGHAVNKGQLDAAVVSSRPYDVYTVEISQIGTSAPTVNFTLENTIGSIVWTRNGVGDYTATLTGAFVVGKTWAVITNGYQSNSSYQKIEIEKQDANTLNIYTYNGNTNTDGILLNANLEIRVYN